MIGDGDLIKELQKGNDADRAYISIIPTPDYNAIRGASVDLHLGRWFSLPHQSRNTHYSFLSQQSSDTFNAKEYFVDFNGSFILHPGRFVLAITLEWIKLPKDRAAYVTGKSNIGRRGLIIETAPGVHPFFNGCLTLEMANLGEVPLEVHPGMKICQLFVHAITDCKEPPESQFSCQIKPSFGRNS
jgi:dCTP deaminase